MTPQTPPQFQNTVPPYGQPHRRPPWIRRHKGLAIAGAVVGGLVVIGAIGNAVDGGAKSAAAAPRATVTRTVTAPAVTRTVTAPTVTRTAAAPAVTVTVRVTAPAVTRTVTATAAPAPATTTPAAAGSTVATFSGSGIQNTTQFTVTDTWELQYTYDCADAGGSGNFIVSEDGGNDLGGASVNELGAGGSSSTQVYDDAGTHYLSINSECTWTVKVVDEG